jgi:hypothetical protein
MPWDEVAQRVDEWAARDQQFGYLRDLIVSIRESGVAAQLAAHLSMMDLVVTDVPIHEPPVEVLVVRGPVSVSPPPTGIVRIEHLTSSGRNDAIERPADETVPLFWRFVREKFGVIPSQAGG